MASEEDKKTIYIEHWQVYYISTNCETHQWCTYHRSHKYKQYLVDVKMAIKKLFPKFTIVENKLPFGLFEVINTSGNLNEEGFTKNFPRMGAFEVYYRSTIVFSKLESGVWPAPSFIAKKLQMIKNNIENNKPAEEGLDELVSQIPKTKGKGTSLVDMVQAPNRPIINGNREYVKNIYLTADPLDEYEDDYEESPQKKQIKINEDLEDEYQVSDFEDDDNQSPDKQKSKIDKNKLHLEQIAKSAYSSQQQMSVMSGTPSQYQLMLQPLKQRRFGQVLNEYRSLRPTSQQVGSGRAQSAGKFIANARMMSSERPIFVQKQQSRQESERQQIVKEKNQTYERAMSAIRQNAKSINLEKKHVMNNSQQVISNEQLPVQQKRVNTGQQEVPKENIIRKRISMAKERVNKTKIETQLRMNKNETKQPEEIIITKTYQLEMKINKYNYKVSDFTSENSILKQK